MRTRRTIFLGTAIAFSALVPVTACDSGADKTKDAPARTVAADQASAITATQQPVAALTPDGWLGLSMSYYQQKNFVAAIGAAQTAAYLKPDFAEAYTNIGASYAQLKLWDLAIQSAQQALHFKPDLALARNNLAWAVEQKRIGAH